MFVLCRWNLHPFVLCGAGWERAGAKINDLQISLQEWGGRVHQQHQHHLQRGICQSIGCISWMKVIIPLGNSHAWGISVLLAFGFGLCPVLPSCLFNEHLVYVSWIIEMAYFAWSLWWWVAKCSVISYSDFVTSWTQCGRDAKFY